MKIGDARVSTEDQNLDLQLAALASAKCDRIFTDEGISGVRFSRPGRRSALDALRPGDTLVVWRLDRPGRSMRKLLELVEHLGSSHVHFVSLTECIDTTTSGGTLLFHIMAALAQFERALISERTRAGMQAARRRGQMIGRKRAMTTDQCNEALRMLTSDSTTAVAQRFNVHPRTLLRNLRREGLGPVQ